MSAFKLLPKAKHQLLKIWQYSYENWGEKQADAYLKNINIMIETICENPQKGMIFSPLADNSVRYILTQKHYLFYAEKVGYVLILAILYSKMELSAKVVDLLKDTSTLK